MLLHECKHRHLHTLAYYLTLACYLQTQTLAFRRARKWTHNQTREVRAGTLISACTHAQFALLLALPLRTQFRRQAVLTAMRLHTHTHQGAHALRCTHACTCTYWHTLAHMHTHARCRLVIPCRSEAPSHRLCHSQRGSTEDKPPGCHLAGASA